MTYIMTEYDYALHKIMRSGVDMQDRTGEGIRAYFGKETCTQYDISERVPVLTYRKVAWQSIVKEILWFISGSVNINDLEASGSKIWTPWKDSAFAEKHGFEDGSIGYGYGFNLTNFGGDIKNVEENPGVNQLDYVINELKTNPFSRRILFTLWRADKLNEVKLPPCHHTYQFTVEPDENGDMTLLNCHMFQRSADYPIGVGMGNLLGGTIFTYLIAQQVGMKPNKLIHMASHAHVYLNAFEATQEYLRRTQELAPKSSPIMKINKKDSIYDYTIEDFELLEYDAYPSIKFPIAI